jgi:hypothetical protein
MSRTKMALYFASFPLHVINGLFGGVGTPSLNVKCERCDHTTDISKDPPRRR